MEVNNNHKLMSHWIKCFIISISTLMSFMSIINCDLYISGHPVTGHGDIHLRPSSHGTWQPNISGHSVTGHGDIHLRPSSHGTWQPNISGHSVTGRGNLTSQAIQSRDVATYHLRPSSHGTWRPTISGIQSRDVAT